jgi:hypothetical protein
MLPPGYCWNGAGKIESAADKRSLLQSPQHWKAAAPEGKLREGVRLRSSQSLISKWENQWQTKGLSIQLSLPQF